MKAAPEKIKTRLKVKDEVIVIAGKHKKSRGEILRIDREKKQVVIKGVNLRKRFARPTQENPRPRKRLHHRRDAHPMPDGKLIF